jgi:hypothetical protein
MHIAAQEARYHLGVAAKTEGAQGSLATKIALAYVAIAEVHEAFAALPEGAMDLELEEDRVLMCDMIRFESFSRCDGGITAIHDYTELWDYFLCQPQITHPLKSNSFTRVDTL